MNNIEDFLFKKALEDNNLLKLKEVPKADVHSHCLLGMRFATFNKMFGGEVPTPPKKMDGLYGFDEYIFKKLAKYISHSEQLEQLLEATILEAINDGVKILETSVDTNWLLLYPSYDDCFSAIKNIQDKYSNQIDFRPELGIVKSLTVERMDNVLSECIDSGIFKSLDLYGDESIDDFERFKDYFIYAKSKGLKLKAHAGEFSGSENVRKAIEILDLDEVQHGIAIYNDDYSLDLVKERGIRLNICPSSNLILGAVNDLKSHPIKTLFDKGVLLSINTDDLLVFNQSVSEEFLKLYQHNVLGVEELNEIRKTPLNLSST